MAVVVCTILAIISPLAAGFGFIDNSSTNLKRQHNPNVQRRQFIQTTAGITIASLTGGAAPVITSPANAIIDVEGLPTETVEVPMKTFVDNANPSLFAINVPQRFFAIRRTSKGDLPDAKTGKGRRGGTIFSAGDMAKAEVIAVER